ncbi:MAG: arylsulfotransferase family protein, partial [Caulobacterales bacterium]|nr:arylsulfotransferase family protein [Caulobacterales bacterium]
RKGPAVPDYFHPNDVEELPSAYAEAFPDFEPGDLLISLRSLNMVAIVSPAGELKWARYGPWFKQHDPDFLPDGRISIFNNGRAGHSDIMLVDPSSGELTSLFAEWEGPFYTGARGKHQTLPNGNIMLTIPQQGQAYEVTTGGEIVMEYNNVLEKDTRLNEDLVNAIWLPPDYFDAPPSCAG